MKARVICVVVLAMVASMGSRSSVLAANDYPIDLDRLREEQERAIRDWIKAGQRHIESYKSPLITADNVERELPSECIQHLREEKKKLKESGYSRELWLRHVFECEQCCAPLLADLMVMHVSIAVQQPHIIVLFNFDTYHIKEKYKQRIDDIIRKNFNKNKDKILMIGRASNIGTRPYNIVLSGRRAGEIKDYIVENFGIDESRIRYLYFGYDPPQLTFAYAKAYGVTAKELASIDAEASFKNSDENKINQSVVIIIYQDADDNEEPQG